MGQKPPQWDGKIYRAAKPGEGFRWDTRLIVLKAGADCTPAQTLRSETTRGRTGQPRAGPRTIVHQTSVGGDSRFHRPAWPSLLIDQSNLGHSGSMPWPAAGDQGDFSSQSSHAIILFSS
jgi:hypothetical protein